MMTDADKEFWSLRHAAYQTLCNRGRSGLGPRPARIVADTFAKFAEKDTAPPSLQELRSFVEEALLSGRISMRQTPNFGRKSFKELMVWLGQTSTLLQCPCCEKFLWLSEGRLRQLRSSG